ncbi:beta strand repeat-containing protein [Sphaerotilus hippei]|uniref:beta strand repeat-containing protein n=1 Tax=Sphaerotilus hippei TaxID=744406 RepID=UPI0035BF3764
MSQPAATDLTVQLTYSGTATDGSDYTKVVSVTVPAGSASTTFDIATIDDALADNGESFTVTLGTITGGGFEAVAVDPTTASVTTVISDDVGPGVPGGGTPGTEDTVTISLTGPGTVVEGQVATGYTVQLSQPAATDLTFQLTYSGTATDGSDYTKVISVTVPAGSASTTFDITTLDDALADNGESFTVTLGTITGGGFESVAADPTAASVTTVISDDVGPGVPGGGTPGTEDTVTISLTGPGTVVEGEVATGYTVHLSQPAATDLTVQLTYSGTATDGSDYTKVVSVTVPAGSASTSFDITTLDDALADNGESFTVTLGTITGGGFEAVAVDPTAASVTTVIADDVGPGVPGGGTPGAEDTVTISLTGPGTVVEGQVATGYTVQLSQPAATDLTVQLTYSGTATDGSDYTKVVSVTVPAGSASTSFDLATLDDALAEGSESVTVTLGTITGGGFEAVAVDPTAASVTTVIADDVGPGVPGGGTPGAEDTVTISLTGPGSVVEGEVATGYTVHLSQPAATDLTVQLTYSGTATDGSDYTKVVSVTVPAGSASTSFDLATLDDALAEGSESVTVTLGAVTGGGFEAVAVDPTAVSVTTVISDDVGPGVPGGGTPGTEDTVTISLTGPGTVVEGEVATGYTVHLSQPAATDLTVQLTYSGTATDGSDYTKVISVTVPAGSASTSFDLATLDDALAEGSESVTVTLGAVTGGGFEAVAVDPTAASVTTVIADDVGPGIPGGGTPGAEDTVNISLTGPGTVVEGEVATGYTVHLSQPAATDLTVQLTYSGTATDGSDYTKVVSVTVPAGSASTSFDLATLDDALAEGSESVTVTLGTITGGGFEAVAVDPTAGSITTVIVDDVGPDAPGVKPGPEDTVSISLTGPGTVVEGEVATGYTVQLSQPAATDLTVQLTYSGTATDGSDYTKVISVTVPAGSASTTFDITTLDDALADNGESFTVTLGAVTGGGFEAVAVDPTAASVTTVISDDIGPGVPGGGMPGTEDTVTIGLTGPGTVVEGEVATGYTVHLSQPAATDLTVQLTYSGTATDGSDYTKVVSVTVPAGSASSSFDLATLDDALAEGSESVTVTLGAVTGGGFEAVAVDPTAASVTTVISDDVGPGVPGGGTPGSEDTVTISLTGPGTVVEGEVATGYTVNLSQPAATDLTVQLTYSGTATDGSDYTKVISVTVPAGSASTSFDLATLDDALAEGSESVTVTLGAVTGGGFETIAVDPTTASITTVISDDVGPGVPGGGTPGTQDTVTISLTGPGTVVEGEVATGYTVQLSQPAATDLTVQLTYSGTATDGSDYTKVISVTVPAGSASTSFDITTLDDALADNGESFTVTLGAVTGGGFEAVAVDPVASSVTTIISDDVGPGVPGGGTPGAEDTVTISLTGPGTVVEGEVACGYTVHLSQPAASEVTVELIYSGTATDGSDFSKVVSVTIPAGSASADFDIATIDDALVERGESFIVGIGGTSGGGFEALAVDPVANAVTTAIVDDAGPAAPGGPGAPGVEDTVLVSISGPGSVIEGETASGYTVCLSHAAATDMTVQLIYTGTATNGEDFQAVVSVTIPAGSASAAFEVPTLDDALAEVGERFTIAVGGTTGGGFEEVAVDPAANAVTTTIVDDAGPDLPPGSPPAGPEDTVLIGISGPDQVGEGEVATGYVVHLSQAAVTDLTVQLTYGGTATDGSDYMRVATVTIPAGASSVGFDLATLPDGQPEGAECIVIGIGATHGGGFEVLAVDGSAAQVVTAVVDPATAPQISGPLDVRVSEEGLAQGLADGTGARAGDDTGNSRSVHGQLTLSDADSASLQVTLTAPTTGLSCGGQPVVWTGDGTGTLVGHIGSATGAVALSITIDASGAYDVTLDAALDHALQGEDLLSLDVGVRVSDGTHTSTATLTVGIEDDAPTASHSTATLLVRHDSIRISQMDAGFSDDTYRNNDCDVSRSDTDSHDGNIDQLRWGQAANDQNRQSGYDLVDSTRLTTATGATVEAGEVFKLADFTHRNYAIASGSSTLKETDLDLTMAVEINGVSTQVTFTAHLVHTETPNSSDAVASRDIIQLPAQTVTVQVNGQDYEVNLLGFKDSSGQLLTEIRTDENTASNTFGLYGSVTPTDLPPDLVGQVQVDAGADGLAAIRWSDTGSAYGTFTGDADGSYTFVMNQATREALAASGEALTQTFTYQVVDRDGDVTSGSVTVALAREETLAPVTLTSTTQTIDSDSIGLGGEYFGYNDNRTGTAHDATFSGATRLHADDGSATLGGNTSTNLNHLADIEHIVEGRNGNTDLVGNAQLSLAGAADATFTMRNVEFGLVAGTDQALFSTDLGQSGSTFASGQTVTGNNLDRFLHGSNAGNASAITATSGMGDSTDAIIRAVGYIDMTGGTYDIRVTGDDGYRLLIGGETVAEVDVNQYVAVRTFTGVDLSDGLQPIEILYWDQGGHASLRIELKPSGAADTDYKVLGSDEYALFAPGEVPVLGAQQDIVESSTNGVWEIRTGQDYTGTSGNDQVTGSDGKDVIRGGAGRDTIDGAQGDDRLEGGSGHDVLTGGQGADVFAWSLADAGSAGAPAHDTVTDFKVATVGGDALDLRDLLQGENHANLTNYLHFETSGSDTVVSISSTGGFAGGYDSSHTDQTITLSGVTLGGGSDMSVVLDLLAKNQLVVDNG